MSGGKPRGLTFIGRDGHTVRMPNHSSEEMDRMARASGLEQLMEQGSADPMALMSAMMSFQKMTGVEKFDEPPEDVIRTMTGQGRTEGVDETSRESCITPPGEDEIDTDLDIEF